MSGVEFLQAAALRQPRIAHAFFSRRGGVSTGVYATLNGGVGSRDEPARVAENRARMASALGVSADRLLIPYLVHSPDAVCVSAPWAAGERPRCDALASATPGLALGVTGADCGILLFADAEAKVVGAAHAGWKGALGGVTDSTILAMEAIGAHRDRIVAAVGPCIARASYEVDDAFIRRFCESDPENERFFADGRVVEDKGGHYQFDLEAYVVSRLAVAGIGRIEALGLDTYAGEDRFFSYRRATHRDEPSYGRQISIIGL